MGRLDGFEKGVIGQRQQLMRLALRLTGNRAAAEDLTQDVLCRAFEKRALYSEDGNLAGWLSTMMRNLHINESRRAGAGLSTSLDTLPAPEGICAALVGAPAQEAAVWFREVDSAFGRMQPGYRAAIVAVELDDLSYIDAAKHLDIQFGTLKSRLSRGRAQLAELCEVE